MHAHMHRHIINPELVEHRLRTYFFFCDIYDLNPNLLMTSEEEGNFGKWLWRLTEHECNGSLWFLTACSEAVKLFKTVIDELALLFFPICPLKQSSGRLHLSAFSLVVRGQDSFKILRWNVEEI